MSKRFQSQKKIEQYLKAAPKPPAPEGLLDKLQSDLSAQDIKTHQSILRRWFAPTGGSVSILRVAAAAMIALAVLLPLTYGAGKIVKVYVFSFESRRVNKDGSITAMRTGVKLSGDFADEEEAKRVWEETRKLKRSGKYERTFLKEIEKNGVKRRIYTYRYTLSNGQVMAFNEYD